MVGLAGQRRAVLEQQVGGDRLQVRADDDRLVGRCTLGLGVGVVGDAAAAAGVDEEAAAEARRAADSACTSNSAP